MFFTDKQPLTPDSSSDPTFPGSADLYECEIVEHEGSPICDLTDLTPDHNGNEGAAVQGLELGSDEHGTSAYFVAHGVLAENPTAIGERAIAGQNNLYYAHRNGATWVITYIATLSTEDSPEWEGNRDANTAFITARASPSGRYFAFMSAAPITGFDNVDANPQAKGARDEEVYLYDSAESTLTCVSCNRANSRPSGVLDTDASGEGLGLLADRRQVWGKVGDEHWLAGNIPGWTAQSLTSALFQPRYLNDEGRLFFNSPDNLVPAATNHEENVYEYEPSGVGSCDVPAGGCVSLISSGTSDRESAFLEASPSGNDAFFVTEGKLLPQDTDTAFDIYDARTCTSAAPCLSLPASVGEGCTETETCRPVAEAPAPRVSGGTATFQGPGNPAAPFANAQVLASTKAKPTTNPTTRREKLARALKACRRRHSHARRKRHVCEAYARRTYGPKNGATGHKHAGTPRRGAGHTPSTKKSNDR